MLPHVMQARYIEEYHLSRQNFFARWSKYQRESESYVETSIERGFCDDYDNYPIS